MLKATENETFFFNCFRARGRTASIRSLATRASLLSPPFDSVSAGYRSLPPPPLSLSFSGEPNEFISHLISHRNQLNQTKQNKKTLQGATAPRWDAAARARAAAVVERARARGLEISKGSSFSMRTSWWSAEEHRWGPPEPGSGSEKGCSRNSSSSSSSGGGGAAAA